MYSLIQIGNCHNLLDLRLSIHVQIDYLLELKKQYNAELTVLSVNEEFLNKDEMIMSRVSVEEIKKNNEEIALNTKRTFQDMLLKLDIQDKWNINGFDAVIGNPPYQAVSKNGTSKGGGNNLYTKFIYFADKILLNNV